VRAIYELWERNEPARHLIDSEQEYVNPPDAVETGTLRDRGALQSVRDVYPDFTVRPERFIDAGAEIVVPGSARTQACAVDAAATSAAAPGSKRP
jgi:hypothetical protein